HAAIFSLVAGHNIDGRVRVQLGRASISGVPFFSLEPYQALVILQDVRDTARTTCNYRLHEGGDFAGVKLAVGKAGAQHFPAKFTDLFVNFHQATWRAASSCKRFWSSGVSTLPVTFAVVSTTKRPSSRFNVCIWRSCSRAAASFALARICSAAAIASCCFR